MADASERRGALFWAGVAVVLVVLTILAGLWGWRRLERSAEPDLRLPRPPAPAIPDLPTPSKPPGVSPERS